MKTFYGTEYVNGVISTHPDLDHACGLKVVLEKLDFGALVMHKPCEHAEEICQLLDEPLAPSKMKEKLRKALSAAHDLQAICKEKGKSIIDPAPGNITADGVVKLLGQSRLLPTAACTFQRHASTNAVGKPNAPKGRVGCKGRDRMGGRDHEPRLRSTR